MAGGDYLVSSGGSVGFDSYVVTERNGHWGKAAPVSGLHPSEFAHLKTLSCASVGNCSAGGSFKVGSNRTGYVVSERNGHWGKAIEVPGLSTLNTSGDAEVTALDCASAGNCTAGGTYSDSDQNEQAFVVSEHNGTWGKATPVPGLATLNAGGVAEVNEISCATPGNCALSGTYKDATFAFQGFVASKKNGTWGNAIELPNLGALNKGRNVKVVQVSCVSTGNCSAGGTYLTATDEDSDTHAFVATEIKGAWGKATQVPGLNSLNFGSSTLNTISCSKSGGCAAGGSYIDRSLHAIAYVVTRK